MSQPEPWLRGTIEGLHPVAAHLLYTFEQALEELERFCSGLSIEELWKSPGAGAASVGFHLRHIAGSVDRLTTYLRGDQLNETQLATMRAEPVAGASFGELMSALRQEFQTTEQVVRAIAPERYLDHRAVGRKQLPTSVGGLIVHLSEHTQRHLGQAVLTARLVSAPSPEG